MSPKKYNKLFNSWRWSIKDTKYDHILYLVVVDQNLVDNSKKLSEKPSRETTKEELAYTGALPNWML